MAAPTTGALEHSLARSAAAVATPAEDAARGAPAPPPSALPAFPAAFALRLPDADRLAVHNEAARLALAQERCLAECRVPAATAPHDVMALSEYFVAGMWVHDRCVEDGRGGPICRGGRAWRTYLSWGTGVEDGRGVELWASRRPVGGR